MVYHVPNINKKCFDLIKTNVVIGIIESPDNMVWSDSLLKALQLLIDGQ